MLAHKLEAFCVLIRIFKLTSQDLKNHFTVNLMRMFECKVLDTISIENEQNISTLNIV